MSEPHVFALPQPYIVFTSGAIEYSCIVTPKYVLNMAEFVHVGSVLAMPFSDASLAIRAFCTGCPGIVV